jgi:hypothetical protein
MSLRIEVAAVEQEEAAVDIVTAKKATFEEVVAEVTVTGMKAILVAVGEAMGEAVEEEEIVLKEVIKIVAMAIRYAKNQVGKV